MPCLNSCRNAVGNLPNESPFNLDYGADPHFADPYSKEIGNAIDWIGFSEGHELSSEEILNICGHICSYVYRTQGEV